MNEFKDSKSAKASKEAHSQVDPRSSMGSDQGAIFWEMVHHPNLEVWDLEII